MTKEEKFKMLLETGEFEFLKDIPSDTMWKLFFALGFIQTDNPQKWIPVSEKLPESGDLISRDELLKAIDTWDKFGVDDTNSLFRLDNLSLPHYVPYIHYDDVIKCIKGMPSVNPREPKTGHREYNDIYDHYLCGNCKTVVMDYDNYCPNCGAKMVEPQESED